MQYIDTTFFSVHVCVVDSHALTSKENNWTGGHDQARRSHIGNCHDRLAAGVLGKNSLDA
jgi:tryptophanyl-tRNA synthetase